MNKDTKAILSDLIYRYPELSICEKDIVLGYDCLKNCYVEKNIVLVAGNGGSAADSNHIVGELMKSFLVKRKIDSSFEETLIASFSDIGKTIASRLEGALPAISLVSTSALTTAFSNDVAGNYVFAQMVYGYGNPHDVFLGLSTSGNSENIIYAMIVAKAKGMKTILLTGEDGGVCKKYADISICVPKNIVYEIQELHLPIYHALCSMLEQAFFNES